MRITTGTNRRLRLFAVTQIAASFVLLAGAGMLLTTLIALQATRTGFNMRNVLALNVPVVSYDAHAGTDRRLLQGGDAAHRRAAGRASASRSARSCRGATPGRFSRRSSSAEGYVRADGEEDPRAQFRTVSPGFFAALGVPIIAGRDFNEADRRDGEKVVIVSQSLAQRMFPNQDAVNRRLMWTDPVMKFIDVSTEPRRIVGVVADMDDENVVPGPAVTVYHPLEQEIGGGRLFVHTRTDPYALVPPITRIIRELSAEQPVEQAATLEDVRAEVLAPDRLNALVFGGFAAVALMIAVVGVAGVLAFSVSARTREFGIRLAIGSAPRHLLTRVLGEGAVIAGAGIVAGAVGGFALARVVGSYVQDVRMPGALPIVGAATDARRRGDSRVADAGRARLARRRHAGAAIGLRSTRARISATSQLLTVCLSNFEPAARPIDTRRTSE